MNRSSQIKYKSLDQIDFEHQMTHSRLTCAETELAVMNRRLEQLLVLNMHNDILEEYNMQKDFLDSMDAKVRELQKSIEQLQKLIKEEIAKDSNVIHKMNDEKNSMILEEADKFYEKFNRIREQFLDFVAYWH